MNSRYLPAIGLAVINSAVQLVGVLAFGWPAGNIFLLLWIENLIITLVAIVRMAGVNGAPDGDGRAKTNIATRLLLGTFVHGVFSGILAVWSGVELTLAMFAAPFVLLVVRYAVETVTWYVRDERPTTLSQAHGFAVRRVVMLHFAIIVCWMVMVFGTVQEQLNGLPSGLPPLPLLALSALLVIKTIAEVRAIRRGPNAGTSWKFPTH
ncbi:hypothetical protein H5392_07690 [Tessaracoccus sp. MC1865]|uniref:DUF6498-containing protein n=1 Tax=Tessaracoccus sp. MC1865 TaxID=2760310 RepID=UPI001603DFB4|nr:DUF6498-containing protein [Tessaracoccus sp. MC1865]MBB1483742.1 hypothetical protein [Tessaracoccus sp. MC1865]QTO36811.1 hypothetical protein J7D54_10060 [Tessaracoccus sp. MC1865]